MLARRGFLIIEVGLIRATNSDHHNNNNDDDDDVKLLLLLSDSNHNNNNNDYDGNDYFSFDDNEDGCPGVVLNRW